MAELIWDGKYDKDHRKVAPLSVKLPFQTVETLNDDSKQRQITLDAFASNQTSEWRNSIQESQPSTMALRLNLDSVSGNLRKLLESLQIESLRDLWLSLVQEDLSNAQGLDALRLVSRHLASVISPFQPSYEIRYSIAIASENRKPGLEMLHQTTYQVEILLPDIVVRSSGILPFILDETFDVQKERPLDILARVKRLAETYRVQSVGDNIPAEPFRLPVPNTVLGCLTTRQRNVIVRRCGLGSGRVETLEKIATGADGGNLTRERIRQIEEKARRRIRHPRRYADLGLFRSCMNDFVLNRGNIVTSEEMLKEYSRYIDFGEYQPSMSLAFLSWYSGLYLQSPDEENDLWFASTSEDDFRKFEQSVKLLTGLNLEEKTARASLTRESIDAALSIMRVFSLDEIESIQGTTARIIGSSRVMRLGDFISCLTREQPKTKDLIDDNSAGENIYRLFLMIGKVSLIQAAEYERQLLGDWVALKLTARAEAIARAIVYSDANQTMKPVCNQNSLKQGARLDCIVQDIMSRSGFIMDEHGVSEICRRNPETFIETDENCWGLIGCGAVRKEHVSEKNNRDERIVDVMTRALSVTKDGLTVPELMRRVRETVPNASENTIRIYLSRLHRERFEETINGKYALSKRYLTHLADPLEQEPVISLVVRVLKEADNPLCVDDIVKRCQQHQFVAESAVRGYLAQNYGDLFQKHEGGKYSLL